MGRYFGTDGFRGEANVSLTPVHAYAVGRFLGYHFGARNGKKAKILIGKDTRRSGYMIESALCAGIVASGADAYIMHVTTTPSISYIAGADNFDVAAMISASHNPYYDNGIKLICSGGEKPDDETTALIEEYIDSYLSGRDTIPVQTGDSIGKAVDYVSGRNRYTGHLISLASHSYKELNIGLDCANGAAWHIAPSVFEALGARISTINDAPSGVNINQGCGSTHIEALAEHVAKNKLDAGFAYDGDADRCIAVDENGRIVDGDAIIYIFAKRMQRRGALEKECAVITEMSNMGLAHSLSALGIGCVTTSVGDRFVYEKMRDGGYSLGGEQSGHIIMKQYSATGDGILTSIMLCEEMIECRCRLSKLASSLVKYPQITVNVPVSDKDAAISDGGVKVAVCSARKSIGERGRVVIRKSGTEPVIRVMAECDDEALCRSAAKSIEAAIKAVK